MQAKFIIGAAVVAGIAAFMALRGGSSCALTGGSASSGAAAPSNLPDAFTPSSFEEAKQLAALNGKPLVVNFSASWCPPCQQMKKNVWTDAKVKDWVAQNAVAVYVDVDQDPDTAKRFKVSAMPTMVIVQGDKELSRVVGGRSVDGLIDWMARSAKQ